MLLKVSVGLVIANALGVVAYLYALAHNSVWYIPEERAAGMHAGTAEPILWVLITVPFFGAFGLINLIWAVTIIVKKRWRTGLLWLAAVCMWLVGIVIDFAHH